MGTWQDKIKDKIKAIDIIKGLKNRQSKGDIYLVGGSIRELCLSSMPKDYDFALTHSADIEIFEELMGINSFVLGKKPIQTYRIVKGSINIDLTVIEKDLHDDLKRRDFSINAIAYDIKRDTLIDPTEGLKDIKERLIRYVKRENLIDDPLRMLKAIRHFATLKGFVIHEELILAISELKDLIDNVAKERIKYELDQIIVSSRAFDALKIMEQTGLIFEIFPELYELRIMDIEKGFRLETLGHTIDGFRYLHHYASLYNLDQKATLNVGYALLFHDTGKAHTFSYDDNRNLVHFFYHEKFSEDIAMAIMERLHFSTNDIRTIRSLIRNHMRIFLISNQKPTERAIRRVVFKMDNLTPLLVLLTVCDMYGSSGGEDNESTEMVLATCREVMNTFEKLQEEPLPRLVTGYDLIYLGYKEGPSIGNCLSEIQERQISGEILTRDEALKYARERLKMHKESHG